MSNFYPTQTRQPKFLKQPIPLPQHLKAVTSTRLKPRNRNNDPRKCELPHLTTRKRRGVCNMLHIHSADEPISHAIFSCHQRYFPEQFVGSAARSS
ncbi:hypothetical protein AVEN_14166-1 [Araneus ventricosus]|uniref:Uncharacterized protein n=1 Tax=Araneus ventricosus TaxID=182803 RepID=A0A4Y2PBE6_ARAVE|nr:hypothetical protein AVEN_14166-1 [Araneus ventricosus]